MTLEQLRIFVAVAELEHMTRAAQSLNLTQSATSAAIAALESRYATKLFNRIGRRIELTDAGRLFVVEARAVLARAAAAETVLTDLAGLSLGSLTLAASQTVGNYWLPPLIHRYQSLHPGIKLAFRIGNTEQVAAWVIEGICDLGLIEGNIDEPALAIQPIADDELVLVVGARHPWAKRRSVAPHDLRATRWVLRERGSGTRAAFESALAKFGVAAADLDVALELPSNEAVRSAVAAGAGATVISKLVVTALLKTKSLVALGLPLEKRHFSILRHKERYLTQAEREFYRLASGKA
ncbi:LysR substrate-binding domain-containing protein [Bradyrhizobium sp. dw_78]|uniref:LysR family transcriptional regulator n=1 Tax=Bradyrhizobium sp. dw_78 TaxID=2719793 RepID=UPI001BD5B0C3